MNLRETIQSAHSKECTDKILAWVGDSQQRFDELFNLFMNDEPVIVQRAGWPVSYAVQKHPAFINKHFSRLLKKLKEPNLHNAVKRNSTRLLQDVSIPVKFQGQVMD